MSSIISGATDERPVIRVASPTEEAKALWETAIRLSRELGEGPGWAVIGGLMVQLHALEQRDTSRLTDDIDLLGDSRQRPSMTRRIAEMLQGGGVKMEQPPRSSTNLGYRFEIDGAIIEVLGPDGMKSDPTTVGKHTTIAVPGGTQALNRSEVVMVSVDGDPPVAMKRPSLLGAILLKARVVTKERRYKFDSDRQDLILLLSLVDDPRMVATSGGLSKSEGKWLRTAERKVDFGDPALLDLFAAETLTRAEQASRLLVD